MINQLIFSINRKLFSNYNGIKNAKSSLVPALPLWWYCFSLFCIIVNWKYLGFRPNKQFKDIGLFDIHYIKDIKFNISAKYLTTTFCYIFSLSWVLYYPKCFQLCKTECLVYKKERQKLWMESHWALFVNNMVWIQPAVQDSQCGQWERFWLKPHWTWMKIYIKSITNCRGTLCALLHHLDCPNGTTCLYVYTCANAGMKSKKQMVGGRWSHVDRKTEARQTTDKCVGRLTQIYLFSLWLGSGWRGLGELSPVVWTAHSGPA